MVRATVAAAVCLLLVALAFVPPLVLFFLEHGRLNAAGTVVAVVSCCLLVGAFVLLVASRHRKDERVMPSGVRIAVTANMMFLAFFALEMCDLLVRRDGQLRAYPRTSASERV